MSAPAAKTLGPARATGPGRAQVAMAIPAGSRRVRGRRAERSYLDALTAWEPWQQLRADCRENVLEVAKQLARRVSYADGTTRRGDKPWSALAGVCETTWKAVRRLLETWGFLATVIKGTTPEFAPMALARGARNTAAVYLLCIPRSITERNRAAALSETRPPTVSRSDAGTAPRATGASKTPETQSGPASGRAPSEAAARGAAAAMAGVMRKAAGQTVTEGWSGWLSRPFLAGEWSARDLLYAIDHPPGDHGQHRLSAAIRHPVGWLRWRLGLWLSPDGTAMPSITQARAAIQERDRNERERHRAAMAAATAGWTDPAPHAAAIREAMGWPPDWEAR